MKQGIKIITLFVLILFVFTTNAQESISFKNSTPRETVESHLKFLENNNYKPEIAAYTLGGDKYSLKQKASLVTKLKDIIIKHGINVENIPNTKGGLFGKKKYILFNDLPKIYLVRVNKKWVYSSETVDNINKIFSSYFLGKKNSSIPNLNKILAVKKSIKTTTSSEEKEREGEDTLSTDALENDNEVYKLNLSTPYHTIVSHLIFLSDSLYNPKLAAKTINFDVSDTANAIDLAIKLYQIYLGTSKEVFDIEKLSLDSNYLDSASNTHIYFPNRKFKELYLEKIGDNWYYSESTSKLIESVHKEMYSNDAEDIFSFSDRFKAYAGNDNEKYLFNLKLWQLYMVLYFLSILSILILINIFIRIGLNKYLIKDDYKKPITKIIQSIIYIVYFMVLEEYVPSLKMDVNVIQIIHKTISISIIIFSTILSLNVINVAKLTTTRGNINSTAGIVIFITLIIKTIIIIISILFIIQALEYNLVNVLAGLSIGGLALALGAQDTIKNFFGSIMIFTDKPFSVGDYIVNDNIRGTVEEVGLRTTKIRTPLNSVVTIPNGKLADNNIDNLGRRKFRRFKTNFTIDYKTEIDKIEQLVNRTTEVIEQLDVTKPNTTRIYMNDFGVYGIEIFISISFNVNDRTEELKSRHTAIREILNICKELGVKIAVAPIIVKE